jgi:hypothetical protein
MPRDKDLKRLVRARMKKTGEAYTAARSQILKKGKRRPTNVPDPSAGLTPTTGPSPAEYATLAGMSDGVVKEKTGRTWEEWVRTLDKHNAVELPHRDIAILVHETYKVREWWTQTVAVGYERIKGLRARGQRRSGTYEATKSRTFNVPVMTLFNAWADPTIRRRWLGVDVKVRTATAPKSVRLAWTDGSIIAVGFTAKGASKAQVALAHVKLPDREAVDRTKQFWTERLDALGAELARA